MIIDISLEPLRAITTEQADDESALQLVEAIFNKETNDAAVLMVNNDETILVIAKVVEHDQTAIRAAIKKAKAKGYEPVKFWASVALDGHYNGPNSVRTGK